MENASFGLTLCAECGLVSALHATPVAPSAFWEPAADEARWEAAGQERTAGGSAAGDRAAPEGGPDATEGFTRVVPGLVAVAVVAGDGDPLLPCGRCRQLLFEAGGPGLLVDTAVGPLPLAELLPAAFGGADLSSRRDGN